jgi:hypothetical protein
MCLYQYDVSSWPLSIVIEIEWCQQGGVSRVCTWCLGIGSDGQRGRCGVSKSCVVSVYIG